MPEMIVTGNRGESAESVNDTKETKRPTQRSHWNPRPQFNYSPFLPGSIIRIWLTKFQMHHQNPNASSFYGNQFDQQIWQKLLAILSDTLRSSIM